MTDLPSAFAPKFTDVTTATKGMSQEDLQETAAYGSLVDWELVNFLGDHGLSLCRLSFTWRDDEVLLVVKVRRGDLPYVVFVSRPTPRACVRTFVKKVKDNTLALYPDRFA